jgi:hypothetical protein
MNIFCTASGFTPFLVGMPEADHPARIESISTK